MRSKFGFRWLFGAQTKIFTTIEGFSSVTRWKDVEPRRDNRYHSPLLSPVICPWSFLNVGLIRLIPETISVVLHACKAYGWHLDEKR
jgi:hypothetical protein